jgi:hypothetical protein
MTRLAPGEAVTPDNAGWRYLSFSVRTVSEPTAVGRAGHETAVVALGGGPFLVGQLELPGRPSVWEGRRRRSTCRRTGPTTSSPASGR